MSRRSILAGVFLALPLALAVLDARSMPILMDRYDEHPLSVSKYRGQCSVCHVYEDGSGALTAFGEKYDRAGLEFTPELVREYGNLFHGGAEGEAGGATAEAAVPAAVPGNEPWNARHYYREECQKCHGRYGDGDPFQGVPAFATKKWLAERGSKPEELLQIILHGKDKMIGHAGKITEEEARELLEGVLTIARKYSE